MMRWIAIGVGVPVWLAAIGASIYLNWSAGVDLDVGGKGIAIGAMNVAADLWKGLCPVFLWVLWRNSRRATALLLGLSWVAALIYAMTNALGVVAERRGAWTEGREATRASYESVAEDLAATQERLKNMRVHRASAEVKAAIEAVLARPVKDDERIRGTVGSISKRCERQIPRTAEACAEVSELNGELETAIIAESLEARNAQLKGELSRLRDRGGKLDADPYARLISRLTLGWIAASDAPLMRFIFLALFIELFSAFLPVGIVEFAHATRQVNSHVSTEVLQPAAAGSSRLQQVAADTGRVVEWMAQRTEPTGDQRPMGIDDLYADYEVWCLGKNLTAAPRASFAREFETVRQVPELEGKIRKFGTRYYGIRLVNSNVAKLITRKK